jgi:hypothetical protein
MKKWTHHWITLSIMMEDHEPDKTRDKTCTYSENEPEAWTCTTVTTILSASVPVQGTAYLGALYGCGNSRSLKSNRELINVASRKYEI